MKRNLLSLGVALLSAGSLAVSVNAENVKINGGGASFPAPVYNAWTYAYSQGDNGATVNYQSMGSGAGINQIKSKTLDYAGSDNPLTLEQQKEFGLQQFPMLTGGVVLITNIPGVKNNELKLSREVLSDIFLGKIKKWNDSRITSLNPKLRLPALNITIIRRADASGTTFIFTNYLSKISKEWSEKVGFSSSVKWPVGLGGQKNPGVCNMVKKSRGSIGYTEYTYATETQIPMVVLENADGKYVEPNVETFTASAGNADWKNAPGFYMVLTNQPGAKSWPITGVTYCLLRNDTPSAMRAELIKYFKWCFTKGQTSAKQLHYVPIPENVVKLVMETL